MANSAGMCSSFKQEILTKNHNLDSDVIKLALFLATATRTPADTAYSTTGELAGTGNYTQGGKTITNGTTALDSTTAHWTPGANETWTALTPSGAFDAALLYNSTATNKAIAVFTFSSQSSTGDFTLSMPTDNGTTGLIRIA